MQALMLTAVASSYNTERTFTGTTLPQDGLTKLKQMESSTGIWTMRCILIVDRRHIVIIDKGNGVTDSAFLFDLFWHYQEKLDLVCLIFRVNVSNHVYVLCMVFNN